MSETSTSVTVDTARQPPQGKLSILALSALGIVFGDIGTSPLYTFKTILGVARRPLTSADAVLGALSLVLWTLFIITTVKYVSFAMRVDNDGEGGILALMALLGVKRQQRPTIVAVGLFGAALIYGDGAITPAISVLSALEGLNIATPALQPYVVPAAVAILLALFAIQSQGTAAIGHLFGPVMLVWFVAIAVMGISGIVQHPSVFAALNPVHGLLLFVLQRGHRLSGAGRGVSLRHRRRGALCRYGPFRQGADPAGLVCGRLSKPDPELCRAGRAGAGRRADRRQYFLSALSRASAAAADRAGDGGDDHCQPVDHHRRVLDDPAGNPARLAAEAARSSRPRRRATGRSMSASSTGC